MPRGRPGITPKQQVKVTKEKPEGHQGLGNHGNLPGPGPGRPKGSRNKYSGDLKQDILTAIANTSAGDAVDWLIKQAEQDNPSPMMSLIGKTITQETAAKVTLTTHFTWGAVLENEDRRKGETTE